ncbi:DUF2946 family protein [Alcaligenes faecalis]|uniref:DUF2946 family protein n=1 Tax=Alcaligenes faecalis TaxID=511 RepID=UPI000F0BD665|nr:DUF2946 family protein [Alcaligenes faecalis]AYR19480.1 DUF2946 domain-containing protein [Alcaligenes faecalis]
MHLRRKLRTNLQRIGYIAVALVLLVQGFAVASMPMVSISTEDDTITLCTSSGMKTIPLSELGLILDKNQDQSDSGAMSTGAMCVLCPLAHAVAIPPTIVFFTGTDLSTQAPQAPPAESFIVASIKRAHQARAPPSNT